ncbi:septum site-determining protein Ssd [Paenarthrobacter sp. S56]|uniref:septum site-determining protein Ssd n=1 Tax=Paenarthrobacter sp. S56 TaxID=3138179 RepID=UPI00321AE6FD
MGKRLLRPGDAAADLRIPGHEDEWSQREATEILLVTENPYLLEEARRIAAAAGGRIHSVTAVEDAVHGWDTADVVLVGSDVHELPPRRRAPDVLLGTAADGGLWRLAAALGAERVAVLPEGAAWLAEHLSMAGAPDPGGAVLGIVGGHGGAGATTTAIWLAQAAAGHGMRTLLVDGDPWGGGLELAITDQDLPGLRWPDFAETRGSIDAGQFRDSLPVAGGFQFLSWPGTREKAGVPDAGSVGAVMDAARRSFELVVVDIARGTEGGRALAWDCDRVLLVTRAALKAAVATARILGELPPGEVALAVRTDKSASVDAQLIAESLGLPLRGVIPDIRGVAAGTEAGRLLEIGRRRPVARFAADVLDLNGKLQ